ncbi:MAG TPA: heterodisulfide reductase-related iron-sulfur binding cluster [Bacteroidales bacterium]|nr:heterodisulfide reductase-related iron-sulfur binding cluster [Bacteroidales bacterium]HRZ49773.1 heterodisulfide reductase-related iron-sulfur binding cluster [Bacteroidales bacterium]
MLKEGKKYIWKDYQKEIADNHYYYARSCIRQNFFPGSEATFLRILKNELNKDIFDDPEHTTCTGIGYHSDIIPLETTMTVVARHFALMTAAGYKNLVPSCITSFGIYSEILETWHEFPETLEKTREHLFKATGREFNLPENVVHTSDIIFKFRDEIAARGRFRLIDQSTGQPLRIVEHIGCHYARMFPHKGIGGAEYPYVLAGMVESWGGEVIDYPERRHCCGFGFRQYLVQANRGYSLSCSRKKFESMEPYKPDMIITNCPGCPYFLDRWQYVIAEQEGKTYGENGQGIPVFTYEEVAGLVLGYDPWDLGLQVHQINVEPLLDKMGIPYNPDEKYAGPDGQDLGQPAELTCMHNL